jgi:hypothetical protein
MRMFSVVPPRHLRLLSVAMTTTLVLTGYQPEARAKYLSETFRGMATKAELVVVGEVVALAAETFTLRIQDVVKIKRNVPAVHTDQTIEVRRFRDWQDAKRWTEYSLQQKLLLFLRRHGPAGKKVWSIIGAGAEGEMPIVKNLAYLGADLLTEGTLYKDVYGARYVGEAVPLNSVLEAIKTGKKPTPRASAERRGGRIFRYVDQDQKVPDPKGSSSADRKNHPPCP